MEEVRLSAPDPVLFFHFQPCSIYTNTSSIEYHSALQLSFEAQTSLVLSSLNYLHRTKTVPAQNGRARCAQAHYRPANHHTLPPQALLPSEQLPPPLRLQHSLCAILFLLQWSCQRSQCHPRLFPSAPGASAPPTPSRDLHLAIMHPPRAQPAPHLCSAVAPP